MIPSISRLVHYVLPNGQHRPAIIVRVWDPVPTEHSLVQLQVFTDGGNDLTADAAAAPGIMWRTSVHQDATTKAPGSWHAPEHVEQAVNANLDLLAADLLNRLADEARQLCYEIEKIPAGVMQTSASLKAAELLKKLTELAHPTA